MIKTSIVPTTINSNASLLHFISAMISQEIQTKTFQFLLNRQKGAKNPSLKSLFKVILKFDATKQLFRFLY